MRCAPEPADNLGVAHGSASAVDTGGGVPPELGHRELVARGRDGLDRAGVRRCATPACCSRRRCASRSGCSAASASWSTGASCDRVGLRPVVLDLATAEVVVHAAAAGGRSCSSWAGACSSATPTATACTSSRGSGTRRPGPRSSKRSRDERRTRRLPASWSCATRTPTNRSAPSCTRGSTRRCPTLAPQPPRDAWAERRKWDTDWQRRLFDAGYAGLHWPKEYGGRGASPTEQLIFYEETARARAPYVGVNFVGTLHAGPTLIEEGTDAAEGGAPPEDPPRRRGVVPGVLRAGRGLRPRVAAHPRRCATATTTS